MDISTQTPNQFHHHHQNNVSNNMTNTNNNNNNNNNNNISNNIGNIKALLASPIAPSNLRVVHQTSQQSKRQLLMTQTTQTGAAGSTLNRNATGIGALIGGHSGSYPNGVTSGSYPHPYIYQQQQQQQQNSVAGLLPSSYGTGSHHNHIPNNQQSSSLSSSSSSSNNHNNHLLDLVPQNAPILGDRYLVLNLISGSSFYNCIDIRTGDALACKAVGNSYSKILSAYFRLDDDPHIKPLHKLLQSSDQTYLLLPPSQYGDLHSYVRERKRLSEKEARHLFRQICKTVKSCHQQGIVLRDLKLRKFVFSDHERTHLKFESLEDAVVLEDPDNDILKEKIGCPAYVAPEILKPNSDFSGKAADLWSLGVILYTMLVGRYPFNDPEHSSLFAKIARCQFKIPDDISSKARCLIKSLLQRVPKHRITSEDILYHPWLQEDLRYNNSSSSSNNSMGGSNNSSCNDLTTNDDQCVPDIDGIDFT